MGKAQFPRVTSQSDLYFLPIGGLHASLRLAFLPVFHHPPITYPLPRCSVGHSSPHPLCHSFCLHLLRYYHLCRLYTRRAVVLGNVSSTRLVSFLSPRHRQGLVSHRPSLRRASLRERSHRIRMEILGSWSALTRNLEQLDRMAQLHRRPLYRGSVVSLASTLSPPPDSASFFPIHTDLRNPTLLWHSAHPPFL